MNSDVDREAVSLAGLRDRCPVCNDMPPNVALITCGAQRRQVHRLVGQHSKRGVWHRYASL